MDTSTNEFDSGALRRLTQLVKTPVVEDDNPDLPRHGRTRYDETDDHRELTDDEKTQIKTLFEETFMGHYVDLCPTEGCGCATRNTFWDLIKYASIRPNIAEFMMMPSFLTTHHTSTSFKLSF